MTLIDRVYAYIQAHQGATAVQVAEALHAVRKAVGPRIQTLKTRALVHVVTITPQRVYYYTDKALADAARPAASYVSVRDMIRAEIAKTGFAVSRTVADANGLPPAMVASQIAKMCKAGELWAASRSHKNSMYFDTEKKAANAQQQFDQARLKESAAKPVPARGATFAPGTPVTYLPDYKHSVGPAFQPRFQEGALPFAMGSQRGRA